MILNRSHFSSFIFIFKVSSFIFIFKWCVAAAQPHPSISPSRNGGSKGWRSPLQCFLLMSVNCFTISIYQYGTPLVVSNFINNFYELQLFIKT